MRKFLMVATVVILCGLAACNEEQVTPGQTVTKSDVNRILINKSTIYKVEPAAVWTTTLNQLQVLTRFSVTPATVISLDGRPALLSQLRPGYKVVIRYYQNNGCQSVLPCYVAVQVAATSR